MQHTSGTIATAGAAMRLSTYCAPLMELPSPSRVCQTFWAVVCGQVVVTNVFSDSFPFPVEQRVQVFLLFLQWNHLGMVGPVLRHGFRQLFSQVRFFLFRARQQARAVLLEE